MVKIPLALPVQPKVIGKVTRHVLRAMERVRRIVEKERVRVSSLGRAIAHAAEVEETNIVDFLAEIAVTEPEVTFDETVIVHEINVVESGLKEALATSAAGKQPQLLEMDKT